jgi:hypothetical protein
MTTAEIVVYKPTLLLGTEPLRANAYSRNALIAHKMNPPDMAAINQSGADSAVLM